MAKGDPSKEPEVNWGEGWGDVTSGYERGDSHKEGSYITVSKHGAVDTSVEATDLILESARSRNLAMHTFVLSLKANEKTGQIAGIPIPVEQATKATPAIRWIEGSGSPTAAWHMGGLLKDYPTLRPKGTVRCPVSLATGPDGLPVLLIPIKAGVSTRTVPREETPGSQTAAGDGEKK